MDKLKNIQSYVNSRGDDCNVCIRHIQEHVDSHIEQKKTIIDMLKMVLSILDAIISKPDNITLRKLRVTHPTLKVSF